MADRRRFNGPGGQTLPPLCDSHLPRDLQRQRSPTIIRPVCKRNSDFQTLQPVTLINSEDLRTGVTPSASGSAYLEMEFGGLSTSSGMKLTCTLHGPRSLPRTAPFSPHMVLSTHVKYAPFASRQRKGYLRDSNEKDLSIHLETALRGAIIADRWPKSGVDVVVTVLEAEPTATTEQNFNEWDMMNVLSGCITVASAAIADAGIDCADIVAGGVAAVVVDTVDDSISVVMDPAPREHADVVAACCVAYLPMRGEITNLWFKGRCPQSKDTIHRALVSQAVHASRGAYRLILSSLDETLENA